MSALSAIAKYEFYVELGNSMPPPVLDKLEYRERRLTTVIETFEALHPGDAYEARLAVKVVLCGVHVVECLRLAGVYREDFAKTTRCRAQAASLMREERAAARMLAQEQKLRRAGAAVAGAGPARPATASVPPPWTDFKTEQPVQAAPPVQTVPSTQAAEPAPQPAPASPEIAPPRPAPTPAATAHVQAGSAPPRPTKATVKAEVFAQKHIAAAAQIRHDRGVTPRSRAYFHDVTLPSDPAVIDALVHGTSDVLSSLDEVGAETLGKAA